MKCTYIRIILENIPNGILPYVLEPLVSSPALKELSKHPCMWKKLIESEVPLSAYQALPTAVGKGPTDAGFFFVFWGGGGVCSKPCRNLGLLTNKFRRKNKKISKNKR